jgi:hypothetical protein
VLIVRIVAPHGHLSTPKHLEKSCSCFTNWRRIAFTVVVWGSLGIPYSCPPRSRNQDRRPLYVDHPRDQLKLGTKQLLTLNRRTSASIFEISVSFPNAFTGRCLSEASSGGIGSGIPSNLQNGSPIFSARRTGISSAAWYPASVDTAR